MINKILTFVSALLFFNLTLRAADENLFNGIKGSQIGTFSDPIIVVDTWYAQYLSNTDDDYFTVEKTQAKVKLWFDDALKAYYSSGWSLTLSYDIELIKSDGTPVTLNDEELTIDYHPTLSYKDINLKVYDDYTFIKVKVTDIQIVSSTVPLLTNDFHFDVELNTRRYYKLETTETATVGYNTTSISTTKELELFWSYVEGAESYDVEWLFVDVPEATLSSVNLAYDFKNATRINCLTNHYKISMAYPRGVFLFRVRPVGKKVVAGEVKRVEGTWSLAATGTTGSVSTTVKYGWTGLLTDMNWQYVANFSEEGKRGEMLGIYDGGLKPRQNIGINNADNTAIISQPVYDYLGRPALTLLPAVNTNQGLGFYPLQTEIATNDYYDYTNFDTDTKVETPDGMSGLGINTYYSNGGALGTHADYVANAENYPYMRVAFLNDGTGRVKWQTAAGGTEIGASNAGSTAKIIRYFYGTPTQEELYRLFGNEAGNASHYKKNCVLDQNGQAHIQYLDLSGRVIATCLAGNAPANLLEIDSYPSSFDNITADLTVNNYTTVDGNLALNKTVVFPYATTLTFNYSLDAVGLTDPCLSGTFNPEYDITIYLEDEDHNPVSADYDNNVGTANTTSISFIGVTAQTPIAFTVPLQAGSYTINKTVALNQDNITSLYGNYLTNQTCETYSATTGTPCNPTCEDLCFSGYGFIDQNGNTYYYAVNGETMAMVDTQVPANTTYYNGYGAGDLADILSLIDACEAECAEGVQLPEVDECEIKYQQMLADMSPGGQYFDNIPFASGDAPTNSWLTTNVATDPYPTIPGTSGWDWDDVRANWNPAWANDYLITEHPEYCIYVANCETFRADYGGLDNQYFPNCGSFAGLTQAQYDQLMLGINYDIDLNDPEEYLFNPIDVPTSTSTTAVDRDNYQPYVDTLADTELDPFMACRQHLQTELQGYLQNYLDAYGNGTEYHSIWFVLDDPLDVHNNLGSSGFSAEAEDLYEYLHGDGSVPTDGLIGTNPGQITKYQFFRSVYLFFRGYVSYMALADYTDIQAPSQCTLGFTHLESPLYNGLTSTGFLIHFPENPLYENYDNATIDTWIDDQTDVECASQCQQYATSWMAELGACASSTDLAIMEAYFIAICEAGCDGDNPQGTDDISPATVSGTWGTFSSFAAVVDYYNTTYSGSCPQVTHPGQTVDEMDAACECNTVTEFVTNFYLSEGITLPAAWDDLAGDLDATQEANLLAELDDYLTITETVNLTDIQGWLDDCAASTTPTNLPAAFVCGDLPTEFDLSNFEDACGQAYDDLQSYYDLLAYNDAVSLGWNTFLNNYTQTAFEDINTRETFTMTYELQEYHYTLFYYDQAGNLIKTVPPSGVYREANGAENAHASTLNATQIQDCFDHVNNPGVEPYIHPAHILVTNYRYNSLQQLTQMTSPDGGETNFWYDELGRLVVSQNAQQLIDGAYSYTIYDVLGRIIEVGEITDVETAMIDAIAKDAVDYYSWLTVNTGDGFTDRSEVLRTVYDNYANSVTILAELGNVDANSVRNRIGSVLYQEVYDASTNNYDYAMHYSYDVNGNVQTVLDENPNHPITGQRYKRLDYEYDLASGNVNQVNYQAGEVDEFYYKYEYDANNRLTVAYTSINGEIWEKESKNFYYAHGPLARLELGDKTVQAQDYVYTLNGWLKTVNSSVNNAEWDAGRDGKTGTQHEYIGRDAYGFSLHYYVGDYVANTTTGTGELLMDLGTSSTYAALYTDAPDLYNGNISKMVVSLTDVNQANVQVHGNAYQYDQLQRIKSYKVYKAGSPDLVRSNNELTSTNSSVSLGYKESYTFDGNGNLLTLNRNNASGATMDAFAYNYKQVSGTLVNNQLTHVDDPTSSTISAVDVDDQAATNYTYNALGQLTHDVQEDIDIIEWTVTGKVKKIIFDDNLNANKTTTIDNIEFFYDPFGNRVGKKVVALSGDVTETFYTLDATGNVIAVYDYTDDGVTETLELSENHIYGGSRLGIYNRGIDLITPPSESTESRILGDKSYELSNHLGNVLEVISDRLLTIDGNTDDFTDYYMADVISYCDYTPFGMQLPGRNGNASDDYRYGFNGKIKDDEIKGIGNSYDLGARMYDPRVGRFFSRDPREFAYPWQSTYVFAANSPIALIDKNGEGADDPQTHKVRRGETLEDISKKYGVTVDDLIKLNNLSTNTLEVGQVLKVNPEVDFANSPHGGSYNNPDPQNAEGEIREISGVSTIVKEYLTGTGPENSIIVNKGSYREGGAIGELMNWDPVRQGLYEAWLTGMEDGEFKPGETYVYHYTPGDLGDWSERWVYGEEDTFSPVHAIGSFTMTVRVNADGKTATVCIYDSKTVKSASDNNTGDGSNIERTENSSPPGSSTYQRYIWVVDIPKLKN